MESWPEVGQEAPTGGQKVLCVGEKGKRGCLICVPSDQAREAE